MAKAGKRRAHTILTSDLREQLRRHLTSLTPTHQGRSKSAIQGYLSHAFSLSGKEARKLFLRARTEIKPAMLVTIEGRGEGNYFLDEEVERFPPIKGTSGSTPKRKAGEVDREELDEALRMYLSGKPMNDPGRLNPAVQAMLIGVLHIHPEEVNLLLTIAVQATAEHPIIIARIRGYQGKPPKAAFFHRSELDEFDPQCHVPFHPGFVEKANADEIEGCLDWKMNRSDRLTEEQVLDLLCRHFGIGKSGDKSAARPLLEIALGDAVQVLVREGDLLRLNV